MDEMEFTEAESNIADLVAEYQQHQEGDQQHRQPDRGGGEGSSLVATGLQHRQPDRRIDTHTTRFGEAVDEVIQVLRFHVV